MWTFITIFVVIGGIIGTFKTLFPFFNKPDPIPDDLLFMFSSLDDEPFWRDFSADDNS